MSPLSLLKVLPSGRWQKVGIGAVLFVASVAAPFLLGSDTPIQDLKKMAAQEAKSKIDDLRPGGLTLPNNFDPRISEGPLAISQEDGDRGSWSWAQAKRLSAKIWDGLEPQGQVQSFYCGCPVQRTGSSGGRIDLTACGVTPRKSPSRAKRLEWEHIVPASIIGQGRSCWTEGASQCVDSTGESFKGRSCCEIADPYYNMAATDPVNLVPSVGEINGDRSNYRFGSIEGEPRAYGACDIEIDSSNRIVEPPADKQGDIARVWAYMSRAYGITVSSEEAKQYRDWIAQDPVSQDEIDLNRAILATGHRANPFVLNPTTPQP